jgi:hypothetical protein
MRDQDVITRLMELHDHIQSPATPAGDDALRGERRVRRRRTLTVVAAAAAAVLTVGVVQYSPSEDARDLQPAPAPSVPEPTNTVEASQDDRVFEAELRRAVTRVADWSIDDIQRIFTVESCAGDGSSAATGLGGGGFDVRTNGEPGQVWAESMGFATPAAASQAVDRLLENLTSCETVAWRAESIAQTGAVLASSADGLIWVLQEGEALSILEVSTPDGPPPLAVQVEVADIMSEYG